MDAGSSVTLIFYSVDQNNLANEPFLNIVAAIAQGSSLTHVEVAIVSTLQRSNAAGHSMGACCVLPPPSPPLCAGRGPGLRRPDGERVENFQRLNWRGERSCFTGNSPRSLDAPRPTPFPMVWAGAHGTNW